MARIETGSLEEMVRQPKGKSFIKAIGGPQFFAGQIFTILATILGVYLAGYVGFQRTLEYDRFVKAQQRSDLLTATQEELKQNIVRLQKFNERLPAEVGTAEARENFRQLTSSNIYDRTKYKERLSAQLKFAEASILPALDKAIGASERLVKKYAASDDASR